jgi:hypothetical protein
MLFNIIAHARLSLRDPNNMSLAYYKWFLYLLVMKFGQLTLTLTMTINGLFKPQDCNRLTVSKSRPDRSRPTGR